MRLNSKFPALVMAVFFLFALFASEAAANGPKVAVLPWKVNSAENMDFVRNAMADMLTSRLGSGVALIRPDQARSAINEKSELTDAAAADAGRRLKADFVLYGSLTIFGGAVSVDARLVNSATGEATPFVQRGSGIESVIGLTDMLSADLIAHLNPGKALPAAVQPQSNIVRTAQGAAGAEAEDGFIIKAKEERERPVAWKSKQVDGLYVGMIAADLDRDGAKEIVAVSANSVVVGSYSEGGFKVATEFKQKNGANIAVCAVDADGDGALEAYISRISDNKAASLVLEHKAGAYRLAPVDEEWLLRSVASQGGSAVLVGQRFRRLGGFQGELKVLKREGDRLVEKAPFGIALPKGVGLYSFEPFDLTGSGEVVALDERGYLTVYARKAEGGPLRVAWRSSDFYGGTLNQIALREDRPGVADPLPIPVEGRLMLVDTNNDGKREVIVRKNTPGGLGRSAERPTSFKTGEIVSLSWDPDGETTSENWRTKQVDGYISDFLVDDLDGDGKKEVVMLVVSGTEKLFGDLKSYILSHRLSL